MHCHFSAVPQQEINTQTAPLRHGSESGGLEAQRFSFTAYILAATNTVYNFSGLHVFTYEISRCLPTLKVYSSRKRF